MKKLLVLRHAKSSWKDVNLSDFDRPLNKRGHLSIAFMKDKIWSHWEGQCGILCSSAQRTRETCEGLIDGSPEPPEVFFHKELYHASSGDILKVVNQAPSEWDTCTVIGHNPGISHFLYQLTGEYRTMVTSNYACIELPVDHWNLVSYDMGKMIEFDFPKNHPDFLAQLDD